MFAKFLVPLLIGVAMSVSWAATDIYLPSLPRISDYFSVSEDITQLTLPVYLLGSLIATPFFGAYADAYGRKKILLFGMGLFILGSALSTFSPSIGFLILFRFLQGAGACASFVIGWAIVQDLYPAEQGAKVMSRMAMTFTAIPLVAPSLGGYIEVNFGWRANFVVIFLAASLSALMILTKLKTISPLQRASRLRPPEIFRTYRRILTNKMFLAYVLIFAWLCAGEWVYLTIAPFYFVDTLGFSPKIFGFLLSGLGLSYVVGTMTAPLLIDRVGMDKTILIGLGLSLAGSLDLLATYFFFPRSAVWISSSVILYFIGMSFAFGPVTSKALQQFGDARASASAVRSLTITTACALGGFAGSYFEDATLLPLSLALGGCAALASVSFFVALRFSVNERN